MAARVLIWGYGEAYIRIANSLIRLCEKGQLEIVGYSANSLPPAGYLSGVPIVQKSELSQIEFDFVVMCVLNTYDEAVREACDVYGIPREAIIPWHTFQLPFFDMDDYLELKRSSVSIISNLCWGGLVYKTLGLPCLTPFRNLFLKDPDYIRLLSDLKHYCTESELAFSRMTTTDEGTPYPIMALDDVELHFNHADSPEQAIYEWEKRKDRINWENLFVEMHTGNPETEKWFNGLNQYGKRICFVPYETNLPHSFSVLSDGSGDIFYVRVNSAVLLNRGCYLYNPISLLLGRDDFAWCTR